MHNGVRTYQINEHTIEITQKATLIAMGPSRGVFPASEFQAYELTIDGVTVTPPENETLSWFHNIRSGIFDNPDRAWYWAWYVTTGENLTIDYLRLGDHMANHELNSTVANN